MVCQCTDSIRNVNLYGYLMHGQHQEYYLVWLFSAQTASGMLFCMVIQYKDSIRNVILLFNAWTASGMLFCMVIQCTDSIRNVILYGSDLGTLLRSAIFRQSVTEYQSGICFDEICSMKFRHDLDSH